MKSFLLVFASLLATGATAQIFMSDSTVQVVGYWNIGDSQSFDLSLEKYKVRGTDTTSRETITYQVDITVKDSTEHTYTIEWFYSNYKITSENPVVQRLAKLGEDMPVVIKTNEFGAVLEVVNWEYIRDYLKRATETVKTELHDLPEAIPVFEQVMGMYMSKEAIESNMIKDIVQFYTFHSGAYKLNEQIEGQLKLRNNFGGEPFDAIVSLSLDEIDTGNNSFVIRMHQAVDAVQLTTTTYEYLKSLGTLGSSLPEREDFPTLTNETWTASRIHGGTGWTTYSIETKEVRSVDVLNVEERIISIR